MRTDVRKILALDIETEPLPEYAHIEEAALIPHMAKITCVGISDSAGTFVDYYENLDFLSNNLSYLTEQGHRLCGHNFKFDLKHLAYHGITVPPEMWVDDTELMARVLIEKVPEDYMEAYREERKNRNAGLPKGKGHRDAGQHSLKMLAPYFLDVPAFWETPGNHHNKDYVLKDCLYTAQLRDLFEAKLKELGHWNFYREQQLKWTKTLLTAELQGIRIDVPKLHKMWAASRVRGEQLEAQLRTQWATELSAWSDLCLSNTRETYRAMTRAALRRSKSKRYSSLKKKVLRYRELEQKALVNEDTSFNFNSTDQLTWLLRDRLGYDLRGYDGEESTDREVLQKLSMEGHEDIKVLLDYRKERKLSTAFYPAYDQLRTKQDRIHTTINPFARTGRTTSSNPNLQQVPQGLRDLFIADPGHVLITRDVGALEPTLIAYFTEDPALMEIVQNGLSFHSINAREIFQLPCEVEAVASEYKEYRAAAKEFGLSVLYGAGGGRVQQSLKKRGFDFSIGECKTFVERLRDKYSGVWKFKQALDESLEAGDIVYSFMGRPIHFADPSEVYMRGFNRLIQGSGSDIVLDAMSRIPGSVLFVHDEVVISCPEGEAPAREQLITDVFNSYELKNTLGHVRLTLEGSTGKIWAK